MTTNNPNPLNKSVMLLLLYMLILILLQNAVVAFWFPQYDCQSDWIPPLFFVTFYMLSMLFLHKYNKFNDNFNVLMIFKTIKMIVSLSFLLLMAYILNNGLKEFFVTFLIYYLFMLIPESIYGVKQRGTKI